MGQTQTKLKKKIKKEREPKFDSREEYFIRNGGNLLEKHIALSHGKFTGASQLKIFSEADIAIATNNYNPDLIVCTSKNRVVYKRTLEGVSVAIKAPPLLLEPYPKLIDRCCTEVATAMVMNHGNMSKLYGCCLETSIPILVYEFLPNASLFDQLHSEASIPWAHRLMVATDVAYALAYMHNAFSQPVVHRGFDSSIILLDCSFHARLSNLGYSVQIFPGDEFKTRPIIGTPGYIDPVYIETEIVTDKSDVYSFGVVMLELLTRRQPRKMAIGGADLVNEFIAAVEKNCVMEMIDNLVLEQISWGEIQEVIQLALTCVENERANRPTMIEVVMELLQMQGREQH